MSIGAELRQYYVANTKIKKCRRLNEGVRGVTPPAYPHRLGTPVVLLKPFATNKST